MAYWQETPFRQRSRFANSPIADVSWRTPARPPKYSDLLQRRKQLLDSNLWWKTATYYTIFLRGINRHLSRLNILHMKDITDGISENYTGTYEWELKYVSHPMPSPYVDSGMDVVVFLSWQGANSEYVLRLYGIHIEFYKKHMILDLRRSSLLITFKL
jgi:hypothetical protein